MGSHFRTYESTVLLVDGGQGLGIADRRVQILRASIRKIATQLSAEGLPMPFQRVLAEATFVINATSTVSGASPYTAVFGRSPALLPELGPREIINDDRNADCPVAGSAQAREIAVQTIAEESARQRLRTAIKTPTRPAGEELECKVGDSVEYYREPTNRDLSGWRGPATITDLTRLEHGRVAIRTNADQVLNCRVQDIRRRLAYLMELTAPMTSHAGRAQSYLQDVLETIKPGTTFVLGQVRSTEGIWIESAHNQRYRMTLQAALYVAEVMFQIQDVASVRIARGVKSLPAKNEYTQSLTLWWTFPGDRDIGNWNLKTPS